MWAKLRDWWWLLGIVVALWFAWPEMRGWGIWTWIGFVLAVAFALLVYSTLFVSGTISQAEERREREREIARAHVAMGREAEEGEEAA